MSATARTVISKAPCRKCPFRKDVPIYLRSSRREEIATSIADGHTFFCHETTVDDGEGGLTADSNSLECAGAAKAVMLSGGTTQHMRIAERLGMADLDEVADRGADVWPLHEWTLLADGATGDNPEYEEIRTCSVVDAGCLAPAGYLGMGGGVVRGTVAADGECAECGEPVCSNCLGGGDTCSMCSYGGEDDDA